MSAAEVMDTAVPQAHVPRGVDWRGLVARDAAVTDGGRKLLEVVDESCRTGGDPETDLRVAAEHLRDAFRAHEARG